MGHAMTDRVVGEWPDRGVTFVTERGGFVLSRDLMEADDLSAMVAAYARQMPDGARPAGRQRLRDGAVQVKWRRIRVVPL